MDAMNQATAAPQAAWGRVRRSRYVADMALRVVCILFTALGAFVLGWILLMLIYEGVSALRPEVFTSTTPGRIGFFAQYNNANSLSNGSRSGHSLAAASASTLVADSEIVGCGTAPWQ